MSLNNTTSAIHRLLKPVIAVFFLIAFGTFATYYILFNQNYFTRSDLPKPGLFHNSNNIEKNKVTYFDNENRKAETYVNGGYFVVAKETINKIKKNKTYWEQEPLNYYAKRKKLYAFKHNGFWKSLDTLKDKNDFNEMIKKNKKPWVI